MNHNNYIYPDFNNCIVNISNSILNEFGVETFHNTHKVVDKYLKRGYKNVVYIVLDGFGSNILDKHLTTNDFLKKHHVDDVTSVFPSSTVSATTSILSGRYPGEHGLLRWFSNIDSINQTIATFLDCDKNFMKLNEHYSFRREYPYKTICDLINEQTDHNAWRYL